MRLTGEALRNHCDEATEGELDVWELDLITKYVREHPAYNALPEEEEEQLPLPEA